MTDRFKKIEGLDYKKGAKEYAEKLEPSDRYHLFTKPFYNLEHKVSRWAGDGLDEDTHRHFSDFANIAYSLALPHGASILDVGCGSGWLSEYFARLGYRMTGVDISPNLIRVAEQRIATLPFGIDDKSRARCQFLVHDIETGPLNQSFDAIICYDSLHHFEDENAVLDSLAAMLDESGILFVAEGETPRAGSDTETELREVMEKFETLEAPFSKAYLVGLLERHGFAIVGDYTSVIGFVDRDNVAGHTVQFVESPSFNYLLCKKVGAMKVDSRNPGALNCQFSLLTNWPGNFPPSARIEAQVKITNAGDTIWLVSRAPLKGRVRVGVKILNEMGETVEETHGWPRLQRALAPGESVMINLISQAPAEPGRYVLKLDLLNQDICWFEQCSSPPLLLPFTISD